MNSIYESRIWKNLSRGKTFQFLVYTLIFAAIFNNMADRELTKLLNVNNETIWTYNYSLGSTGLILVIPAALLSLLIVTILVKIRDRFFPRVTTYKVLVFLLKLIKLLWKAISYLVMGIVYLAFVIANIFSDKGERSSSGGVSSHSNRGVSAGGLSNSNSRKELKKNAEWKARQLQKEADYAYKHAGKQAQYNINSHHFDSRLNRANAKQRKANEAAKRARNL